MKTNDILLSSRKTNFIISKYSYFRSDATESCRRIYYCLHFLNSSICLLLEFLYTYLHNPYVYLHVNLGATIKNLGLQPLICRPTVGLLKSYCFNMSDICKIVIRSLKISRFPFSSYPSCIRAERTRKCLLNSKMRGILFSETSFLSTISIWKSYVVNLVTL